MMDRARGWIGGLVCCLLLFLGGYWRGVQVTVNTFEAQLATVNAAHAEQERARSEAVAEAERTARLKLEAEQRRGNELVLQLQTKTAELDAERTAFNKRLKNVSKIAARDCAGLSAEWVRLYNEALGLAGSGGGSRSKDSAASVSADTSDSTGTTGTGVLAEPLTSAGDILAHVRDYGQYCRKLEAGYRSLVSYTKETP